MENQNRRTNIFVSETSGAAPEASSSSEHSRKLDRLKKPLVFALMGIVFVGCMYLIFGRPSSGKEKQKEAGLNEAVPQATDGALRDKRRAYEEAMQAQKEQEKRASLMSLADYWQSDSTKEVDAAPGQDKDIESNGDSYMRRQKVSVSPLNTYKDIQATVGSFYSGSNGETEAMRREIQELKDKLAEKSAHEEAPDPLAMMEKSYQLASKYFPNAHPTDSGKVKPANKTEVPRHFESFAPARKNVVSSLSRHIEDSTLDLLATGREHAFFTPTGSSQKASSRNSARACIQETQDVTPVSDVSILLLADARLAGRTIPEGTVLTASPKFTGGRLQLQITSVEINGDVIPVEINVYDLNGQLGLSAPISTENSALTEIVANMGTSAGTNLSLSANMGQQLASDMTKSAIQGVSGYFAKKVRIPKVTLKAGHQLLLVSKK
ncbi:Bacteroides conjugative transposon TraM protein [Chitinophaga eiseniae]|uniref:Bacteroides conjugative transposon TraM protein n=1 Tax=Chitinophaga eiseniae TaxID=634771 RepID=A0A1T4SYW4_9BACT|nr:conjugative transposon protein TraM [Chitinophaga eiseniae]SKA33118.1 Bacteroides conjugative transposon TraM protein [Chitinophaga eiseniae]